MTRPVRRRTRQQDARAVALRAAAAGALGVGGLAVGSFAVAALAVGALAVGRLAPGRGQVEDVHIRASTAASSPWTSRCAGPERAHSHQWADGAGRRRPGRPGELG